jgi:hypothetical protein
VQSIFDLMYDPAKRQRKRRLMIYGQDGIGKSTFAAQAPKPLFIQTELGLSDIKGVKALPRCRTFLEFASYIKQILDAESVPFETLVIDSLTGLETLVKQQAVADYNAENNKNVDAYEAIPYGGGPLWALKTWKLILDRLEEINVSKDVWIVLVGHVMVEQFKNPSGDNYDRYVPKLEKTASAAVREWCEEYFFATQVVHTTTDGKGFQERKKAVGSGDRVLKTAGAAAFLAKRRVSMPDTIPLSWSAYLEYVEANNEERGTAALDEE